MAEPEGTEDLLRRIALLEAQLAEKQAIPPPEPAPRITRTQGGAVIEGRVEIEGGHFIGRDFIQTITNIVQPGEEEAEVQSVIGHYLQALASDLAGLNLGEIGAAADPGREPLQLGDIYVPLNTQASKPEGLSLAEWLKNSGGQNLDLSRLDVSDAAPVSVLEAAARHPRLTLLGLPGSGKSTFGAYLLLHIAQTWQGFPDELARQETTWTHSHLLPIRVVLRRFADQLPDGKADATGGDVWTFISRDLTEMGFGLSDKVGDYLQRITRKSGALFLLDGLDECGDRQRRRRVQAGIEQLMKTAGPKCRFVLTARPYAWPEGPDADQGIYRLAEFSDSQVGQFIGTWYAALVTRGWSNPGEAGRKRDDLLQAWHRTDLERLARNPLLLTLMATLHGNKGRLPDDRANLYHEAVELLLLNWNKKSGADGLLKTQLQMPDLKFSDLRNSLEKLAFEVHGENLGHEGTADVAEHRLLKALRSLLNDSLDKAELAIDYIDQRAGLLIGQGEKQGERQFAFPHRTFQEYMAACHLALRGDFETISRACARANPDHWRVVLQLAARVAGQYRGSAAADALINRQSIRDFSGKPGPIEWSSALLAGEQLLEIGLPGVRAAEGAAIIQRVAGWLAAALPVHPADGSLPASERARAGDLLARLGDPRFHGPDYLCLPKDDMLGFVEIPADPDFCIGTRPADRQRVADDAGFQPDDYELNDTTTPTPAFWIARYPVTVAQYRISVEQTGVRPKDEYALRDPDTRPVRYLDWYEAMDYCRWLEQMLRESSQLAHTEPARLIREGWRVALPSELEWEKAARGGRTGAVYPWGDSPDPERANHDETGIDDTATVGCFPANDYGLHDLAGNVWEWTRSLWGQGWGTPEFVYPYDSADTARENLAAGGDVQRVVRGGAWGSYHFSVRCAYRSGDRPGGRHYYLGFRVVLVPAPVSSPRTPADSDL